MEDLELLGEGLKLSGTGLSRGRSCSEAFSSIGAVGEGGEVFVREKFREPINSGR
jgi:hypothetical protein